MSVWQKYSCIKDMINYDFFLSKFKFCLSGSEIKFKLNRFSMLLTSFQHMGLDLNNHNIHEILLK